MEKRIYQTPNTELLHINVMSHLLDWSAIREDGPGDDVIVDIESKRNDLPEWDDFEDEDIEPVWSFNVWED